MRSFGLLDNTQEGNRGPSTVGKRTVSVIGGHPPESHAGYGNGIERTRPAELVDG